MSADADAFEIVPNISEGRRLDVVDSITAAFESPDVFLLDRSSDPDHNRSVLTLAGPGPALVASAVAGARACAQLIDLREHVGAHPRLGALDVLPFVPLAGSDMESAVGLARAAAAGVAAEAGIPVFLYGEAATRAERTALPVVRGRGFEELAELAGLDPARHPDIGGPAVHPSAGATAVGARDFLVAYNVNLAGGDLSLARHIAATVRERDGGLPGVRAIGVELASRGQFQVSMNLTDLRRTGPAQAHLAVGDLARAAGVEMAETELIGLVPQFVFQLEDPVALRRAGISRDRTVEGRLAAARIGRKEPPATV